MVNPKFSKGEWSLEYKHSHPGRYQVKSDDQLIVEIAVDDIAEDEAVANAHLIASAPKLYKALKELLLSTEDALMSDDIGCECERCNQAKDGAYRAIGFAEGKTKLKEGDPRTY